MDITHDNVCSSMLSCFYSHLLSTGRPISSFILFCFREYETVYRHESLLEKVPNIQMRMPTFKNLHFLHKT